MGLRMHRTVPMLLAVLACSTLALVAIGEATTTGAGASTPAISTSPAESTVSFGNVAVGATAGPGENTAVEITSFYLMNGSGSTVTVNLSTGVHYSGPGSSDYSLVASGGCVGAGTSTLTFTPSYECLMEVFFHPGAVGDLSATLTITASDLTNTVVSLLGTGTPTLTALPGSLNFGDTTLGTFTSDSFVLTNVGASTDTIDLVNDLLFSGLGADDYVVLPSGNCPGDGVQFVILTAGAACTLDVNFLPGALGDRSATMAVEGLDGTSVSVNLSGTGTIGYYQVSSAGKVAHFGDAAFYGDASGIPLNHPIVGIAQTGDDGGYWLVASDGGIFNYGDAQFFGSTGAIALNKPIVGMAATPDGGGYWLVASDGGIFSYGDAPFYGSTGAIHLNKPIVGMAVTPDGGGYWLVASDGGIFAYGDAQFYGSTGAITLNKPIVGMAPTPDGGGYWLAASDGGIFAYGDAQFYGSTGAIHLNQPIVAMTPMPTGNGYWFTAADGGLFNYGDAPFLGAATGQIGTVVSMTSDGAPTFQGFVDIPAVRAALQHDTGLGAGSKGALSSLRRFAGP